MSIVIYAVWNFTRRIYHGSKKYLILFWNVQKSRNWFHSHLSKKKFNLILDEALKSVITDALWDNDTISDVTIGTDGFTVTFFEN